MGSITVTRHAPALTEAELVVWYRGELEEMAHEGGTDAYCGNWNSNRGLEIVTSRDKAIFTAKEAENFLEKKLDKRGSVLAIRVGNFKTVFPSTQVEKDLVQRLADAIEAKEMFNWNILDRGQNAKSKTKKCVKCESSINVGAMYKPLVKNDFKGLNTGRGASFHRYEGNQFMRDQYEGLTCCPVCRHELLKTDTDRKAETALGAKVSDLFKKKFEAAKKHAEAQKGKFTPYWLVSGECGD